MSILDYNGSAILAMAGKGCVAIACDHRLGSRQLQTVAMNFQKVFQLTSSTLVGFAGLATDVQTANNHLRFKVNLYSLKEDREMEPDTVANQLGNMFYGRRFAPWFVSPVVAGLNKQNQPYVGILDMLGEVSSVPDFAVAGTATEQLYGVCEAFWREGLDSEELFEIIKKCFLAGLDRDCLAGWGATVYILTPGKVDKREIESRMD